VLLGKSILAEFGTLPDPGEKNGFDSDGPN
jgi:hypothetical protein